MVGYKQILAGRLHPRRQVETLKGHIIPLLIKVKMVSNEEVGGGPCRVLEFNKLE